MTVVAFKVETEISKGKDESGEVTVTVKENVGTVTDLGTGFCVKGLENQVLTASNIIARVDPKFSGSDPTVKVQSPLRVIALPIMKFAALSVDERADLEALRAAGGREANSYKSLAPPMLDEGARLLLEEVSSFDAAFRLDQQGFDVALLQLKPLEARGNEEVPEDPGFPLLAGRVARNSVEGKVAVMIGRARGDPSYCTFGHPVDNMPATFPSLNVKNAEPISPILCSVSELGEMSGGPILVPMGENEEDSGGGFPFWRAACLYELYLRDPRKKMWIWTEGWPLFMRRVLESG